MKKLTISSIALIAAIGCSSAKAAGPLEQWEMSTTMNGTDGAMPGQKMVICKKKDDAARPPPPPNCKYSGTGGGAHGTFVMECGGEHPYTIKGEGTQTATSMEGTMTILMSGAEVKQSYTGKRTGSCDVEGAKMVGGAGMSGGGMPAGMDRSGQMQMLNNPPPYARERPQPPAATSTTPAAADPPPADDKPVTAAEKAKQALKKLLPFEDKWR